MYPVSNDYKAAILSNARAHKLIGTVNNIAFDGADVIRGTFAAKNQLCQATEISLGGVYIGELDLTFSVDFAQNMNIRGSWRGVPITASIGVELEDSSFEYVPIPGGTYVISEANWTNQGLSIIAYDNMSKFDKPLTATQSSGYPYDFLTWACLNCGVTLGMTKAEVEALPNGTENLGLYPDESLETFRDMISKLATVLCCFATIGRSGQLILKRLPDKTDITDEISARMRYSTTFSDYSSYYDSISVVNMDEETTTIYSNDNEGGLILNIGQNPFLQYGTDETVNGMRQAIVDALENFEATPFSVSILPNPAFDLGDLIEFTGGIGLGSLGCVMSFVMRIDSTTLEGYGENPALADARSKADKDISGLLGKTKENELIIHTFENAAQIELLEDTPTTILQIRFATINPKIIDLWHEIDLDVTATSEDGIVTCTAYYYLNDELIAYTPVTTWDNDGMHLLQLLYYLQNLIGGARYDWTVKLEMSGGTAVIDIGNIHAALKGQGLVAVEGWDGLVEAEDEYEPIELVGEFDYDLTESVSAAMQTPIPISVSDTYSPIAINGDFAYNLAEAVTVNFLSPRMTRVTEDGSVRMTEEGDIRITEGGE